jgi:hypothetical protein
LGTPVNRVEKKGSLGFSQGALFVLAAQKKQYRKVGDVSRKGRSAFLKWQLIQTNKIAAMEGVNRRREKFP